MVIDWTINIGNLLVIGGFLLGGLGFVYTIRADVNSLKGTEVGLAARLVSVETELKKMTDVLISLARQDERLSAQDHRIDHVEQRVATLENCGG